MSHTASGIFTLTPLPGSLLFNPSSLTISHYRQIAPIAAGLELAGQPVTVNHHRQAFPITAELALSGKNVLFSFIPLVAPVVLAGVTIRDSALYEAVASSESGISTADTSATTLTVGETVI
jgi:hypothetical protein